MWTLLALIFCPIACISMFTYIIIMGPSRYHRHGVIGKAYNYLVATPSCLCGMLCSICSRCDQTKGKARWNRCCTHLMSERNWVMVGFYMLLVYTAEILYLCKALPHLQASVFSKFISWFLVFLSEFLYTKAILADPGTVTPQSLLSERSQYFTALENEEKQWAEKKWGVNVWKHKNGSNKQKTNKKKRNAKQDKSEKNTKLIETEKEIEQNTNSVDDDNNNKGDNNKCMSILNKITFRKSNNSNSNTNTENAKSKHHFYYTPELEHKLNTRYVVDGILYAQQMHQQAPPSPISLSPSVSVSESVKEQESNTIESQGEHTYKSNTRQHHKMNKRKHNGSSNIKKKSNISENSHKGKEEEEEEEEYQGVDNMELGVECVTCHISKPARSKHCSFCKSCVRRFDHHCPWINNDVAEGTQRYFIGFLLCHAISCTYACWDLVELLKQFLQHRNAWGWQLVIRHGQIYTLTFMDYVGIIITYQTLPACLLFFAFCIGIILYAFSLYEFTYALTNLTMNDLNKIDEIVEYFTELDTLEEVYTEANRIRDQLVRVACRKPTALLKLMEPNVPTPLANEQNKKYQYRLKRYGKRYRRDVAKMLTHDLKGLYDRGYYANLMEVFFPYSFAPQNENDETAEKTMKKTK